MIIKCIQVLQTSFLGEMFNKMNDSDYTNIAGDDRFYKFDGKYHAVGTIDVRLPNVDIKINRPQNEIDFYYLFKLVTGQKLDFNNKRHRGILAPIVNDLLLVNDVTESCEFEKGTYIPEIIARIKKSLDIITNNTDDFETMCNITDTLKFLHFDKNKSYNEDSLTAENVMDAILKSSNRKSKMISGMILKYDYDKTDIVTLFVVCQIFNIPYNDCIPRMLWYQDPESIYEYYV